MRMYQYYNTGDDDDRDIYAANWAGQTFTPEITHLIGKIKLKLFRVGNPGTITISIKNTTANKPSGGDLCSNTIEGTDITTSTDGEWYEITLGSGAESVKNTKYAIVVRAPNGDTDNKLSWRADITEATYIGGTYCGSSDSGTDWSTYSGVDVMFEEWGAGEPSPTTITWGNLSKSQISLEKIEGAILRMIQDHEDDENAHVEVGESLYSHKASEIIDHLINSIIADKVGIGEIWERHRHATSSFKRMLDAQPYQAAQMLKKIWTGIAGQTNCRMIAFDGTYIYVSFWISPAQVSKIDPVTMETVATWTGDTGEDYSIPIVFNGEYIYVGLRTDPGKVVKIDPATMETVAVWTGEIGDSYTTGIMFDGTYIYAGLYTQPAKAIKIDPATMETVDTWTGAEGEDYGTVITFDGIYIYMGLWINPGKVVQINPATMETVAIWTGDTDERYPGDLSFDGTYIYAALYSVEGKVIKITPTTMTTVDIWEGITGESLCYGVVFDGTYLYAVLYTNPVKIVKIDKSDMSKISVWTGSAGEYLGTSITFDGTYIYAGLEGDPSKVVRKIMRDIDEIGT